MIRRNVRNNSIKYHDDVFRKLERLVHLEGVMEHLSQIFGVVCYHLERNLVLSNHRKHHVMFKGEEVLISR